MPSLPISPIVSIDDQAALRALFCQHDPEAVHYRWVYVADAVAGDTRTIGAFDRYGQLHTMQITILELMDAQHPEAVVELIMSKMPTAFPLLPERAAWPANDAWSYYVALVYVGLVLARQGDWKDAALALGAATVFRSGLGCPVLVAPPVLVG